MKFKFWQKTAGSYGTPHFRGLLRLFDRFLNSALQKEDFNPVFDEFCITLVYPPLFIIPNSGVGQEGFRIYYDKLPIVRVNRRWKNIDVKIQAPEFTEHFDGLEIKKYVTKPFDIEERFKNLSEVDLAKILIEKILLSIELIKSKLREEDNFDEEKLKSFLKKIESLLSKDFLKVNCTEQALFQEEDRLKMAEDTRLARQKLERPKNKLIRDLRVYYDAYPNKAFYPYDYQYCEIFLNVLHNKQFMCPSYHHLYLYVAPTIKEGLLHSYTPIDYWHVYGIAMIDYERYLKETEDGKDKMVFKFMCDGLRDIAAIDHLDTDILNQAIGEISKKGVDTELIFRVIENKRYKLTISYFANTFEEGYPVYFTIKDKVNKIENRIHIGNAGQMQLYPWLQNVKLTRKKIKVKSGTSFRADFFLKGKPRTMEFDIDEILLGKNAAVEKDNFPLDTNKC